MPTVSRGMYRWMFKKTAVLEDFADRLSHIWTVALLLLMAAIISINHEYGEPIRCWCPAQFEDSMVRYSERHCWNMRFLSYNVHLFEPFNREFMMPFIHNKRPKKGDDMSTVLYYQWLPLILCFQAMLFKLPSIVMYVLHGFSGINFDKIADLTLGYESINADHRRSLSRQIARYMMRWCKVFDSCYGLPWRALTLVWFVVKILYCVNVSIQFSALNKFLSTFNPPFDNSSSYGDVIYDNMFKNNASLYRESPAFPRRMLCTFEVSLIQRTHSYTVQCEIKANYFNEPAYMFIWVWLAFVTVATGTSLCVWVLRILIPVMRRRYIVRALESAEDICLQAYSPSDLDSFCSMIGEDGVMVLKLMGADSSELLVTDVLASMWKQKFGENATNRNEVTPEVMPSAPSTFHVYPNLETMKGQ